MVPIWDELCAHFEERADYFRIFDRFNLRPDPWLKVECLGVLARAGLSESVRDLRPDRHGCDVWIRTVQGDVWLAVRGLLTSYAGHARGSRPTLASIEEIVREMDKLRGLATLGGGQPALFLAALPFGSERRERDEWAGQLRRFEARGFAPARSGRVPLGDDRECLIYGFV